MKIKVAYKEYLERDTNLKIETIQKKIVDPKVIAKMRYFLNLLKNRKIKNFDIQKHFSVQALMWKSNKFYYPTINYIFSNPAIDRTLNYNGKISLRNKLKSKENNKVNILRQIKKIDYKDYYEYEEDDKLLYEKDNERFVMICLDSTTLWNPCSLICLKCSLAKQCRTILYDKDKMLFLYRAKLISKTEYFKFLKIEQKRINIFKYYLEKKDIDRIILLNKKGYSIRMIKNKIQCSYSQVENVLRKGIS